MIYIVLVQVLIWVKNYTSHRIMYGHDHSKHYSDMFKYIDLIIVDEIDRLKVQHLEQLRAIYDEHNLANIYWYARYREKLSRYPQLYSRIGFAHEFDNLSKDETHHILEISGKI